MSATPDELSNAFDYFVEQMRAAEQEIRSSPAYGSDAERARGYLHLTRMTLKAIEQEIVQDPAHPHFRVLDDRIREGGDNPDQRYAIAKLTGGETYHVWGTRGSAARLEVQLYSEEPYGGKNVGVGYLAHEDIDFDEEGRFSILLAPQAEGRSALVNPPEAAIVQVRQIYDEWTDADPGEVYLDLVGNEGGRKVVDSVEHVAAQLRAAADNLYHSTECWPSLVARGICGFMEVNTMPPLMSPGQRAGVVGRWISLGHFSLAPGEALVVRVPSVGADYRGIQLSDLWFSSLEYGNATSSLSGSQSVIAPDGDTYYVIAGDDPGYANWLDTGGLGRGTMHIRYDGVDGEIDDAQWPSAQLTRLDELDTAIPGFQGDCLSAEQRTAQRAERRRHVQARYRR